jgi:replicative DNA helicase
MSSLTPSQIDVSKVTVVSSINGPTARITVSAQLHYARFVDMPQNPGGGQDWTQQRETNNSAPEDNFGS